MVILPRISVVIFLRISKALYKMKLRKNPERNKEAFEVTDGPLSGQAQLVAKAIPGAQLYYWEYSGDEKNWIVFDSSKALYLISGLTPGQTYHFRFRARTRKSLTDYSQTFDFLVR